MVTTTMNEENIAGSAVTTSTMATTKATREKKKKGLSLSSLKSPFRLLGKTYCKGCHKKCSGEVLRVNDLYFHNGCFNCKGCGASLSQGGFFSKDKEYYCANCYQANFGTKCAKCTTFVEGEVVTTLGKTYHQSCFKRLYLVKTTSWQHRFFDLANLSPMWLGTYEYMKNTLQNFFFRFETGLPEWIFQIWSNIFKSDHVFVYMKKSLF